MCFGIVDSPVTIKSIECAIVDKAWKNLIKPQLPEIKTGKNVAVIGSGPAGLAASQQLARAGHKVILYEKNKKQEVYLDTAYQILNGKIPH